MDRETMMKADEMMDDAVTANEIAASAGRRRWDGDVAAAVAGQLLPAAMALREEAMAEATDRRRMERLVAALCHVTGLVEQVAEACDCHDAIDGAKLAALGLTNAAKRAAALAVNGGAA